MIGTTLSHYRIEEELGRGGMGIVYRGVDMRLERTVAIKVLPSATLADEELRLRFFREAKAAAQLNHPNICQVYEVDEARPADSASDEVPRPFIAMEYIEGESLAARIQRGPLKIVDAVRIAGEMAEALGASHEKGIVHRDVKSGNVMLSASGPAKVLDFGLAKTAVSTKLTRMDSTVGTAAYMSPEQARGEDVDSRTDLYSLGVVLYEMVAGRLPHPGEYEQAVLYGILNEDPAPLTAVRTGVPMALEWIVTKCLAKDPALRYQHAADLVADLKGMTLHSRSASGMVTMAQTSKPGPGFETPRRGPPLWAGTIVALLLGLLIGWFANEWQQGPSTRAPAERIVDLAFPEGVVFEPADPTPLQTDRVGVAISPDASHVAFVGRTGGVTTLYVRSLETGETRQLSGTANAYGPFFSPDGEWIAYFAKGRLWKIRVEGGAPVDLAEASLPYGGSWGADGRIIFSNNECGSLTLVSSSGGGTPSRVAWPEYLDCFSEPTWIPGTNRVLVGVAQELRTVDVDTGQRSHVGINSLQAWSPNGRSVVFSQAGQLWRAPFDRNSFSVDGSEERVVDSVLSLWYRSHYSIADDGTLVYAPGPWIVRTRFAWLTEDGELTDANLPEAMNGHFSISPDGRRVATAVRQGLTNEIWIYDLQGSSRTRLPAQGDNNWPIWTPDGERVIFTTATGERRAEVSMTADGLGGADTLYQAPLAVFWVAPDGKHTGVANGRDLFYVSSDVPDDLKPMATDPDATETLSDVSHDGRFVAYTSDQTGMYEVYVQPMPPTGDRRQISAGGGEEPVWSPQGDRLFYRNGNRLYKVEVSFAGESPVFSDPKLIFDREFMNPAGYSYDAHPDGRLLVLIPTEKRPELTHLRLVYGLGR